MTDENIKAGSGGRPPGCFYFKEDHELAAQHVRKKAPEVFAWIKAHPDGLPGDLAMHQLMWRTAMEVLPNASLIDHANVGLILRRQADPPTEEEEAFLKEAMRLSREWRRRRRH